MKTTTILRYTFYEKKEMQDIKKEYYQIKGNLIISILYLTQHNCKLSRLPTGKERSWGILCARFHAFVR